MIKKIRKWFKDREEKKILKWATDNGYVTTEGRVWEKVLIKDLKEGDVIALTDDFDIWYDDDINKHSFSLYKFSYANYMKICVDLSYFYPRTKEVRSSHHEFPSYGKRDFVYRLSKKIEPYDPKQEPEDDCL
jgi:hypothetical protein